MNKMKMILAASLFVTACGTVQSLEPDEGATDTEDAGTGSGSGADTGSGAVDAGIPLACTKSSECGAGELCDTSANECMTPEIILDASDFVVQGATWWTNVTNPIVKGTFKGPAGATLELVVGSGASSPLTVDGDGWLVQLPQGSIQATDTPVTIRMIDSSGGLFEKSQLVAQDVAGPNIAMSTSLVKDERADQIDFSTSEPVHSHSGTPTDLATGECPSVYKYAYLMDVNVPYGIATSPNPLAWNFSIVDAKLKPGSEMIRVRTDAGQTVLDWRAITPNAAGNYSVELTRSGGANASAMFGTRTGKFFLDVRARDWANTESVKTYCWDHNPLQAPVSVEAFAGDQLFGISLPNDSTFGVLLNYTAPAPVGLVQQRIVQQTAEATRLTYTFSVASVTYNKTTYDDWVVDAVADNSTMCPTGNTKPECRSNWEPAHFSGLRTSGGVVEQELNPFFLAVIDEQTNQVVTTSANAVKPTVTFDVAARAPGESPRSYRIVLRTAYVHWFKPPSVSGLGALFAEYALLGKRYTGDAAVSAGVSCAFISQTAFGPVCQLRNNYYRFTALDSARMEFQQLSSTITQNGGAMPYVPQSVLAKDSLLWDSGDDDLPGSY